MTTPPKAFISYAWESDAIKDWVRELATQLRKDGVNVTLDQWHTAPGDQLPHFMESAVRTNDYVVIICTPTYKQKSDHRRGGVGYEGDIMTAEVMADNNHRKFIPVLRTDNWRNSAPSWLSAKFFVDLREAKYDEGYNDLLTTLLDSRPKAPPLGRPPTTVPRATSSAAAVAVGQPDEPIRIKGVIVDEVDEPRLDGTPGSGLYKVPFQLSRTPSPEWADLFVHAWNHPPRYTSMHRPRIARVVGSKVVLDGTTIEEVKQYHRETLVLAVEAANIELKRLEKRRQQQEETRRQKSKEHASRVRMLADDLDFD